MNKSHLSLHLSDPGCSRTICKNCIKHFLSFTSVFTHTICGRNVNIPHSHLKEHWSENTNKNKPPFWWEGAPKTLVSLLVAHFDTTQSPHFFHLFFLYTSARATISFWGKAADRPWTTRPGQQYPLYTVRIMSTVLLCQDRSPASAGDPGALWWTTTASLQSLKQSYTVQSSTSRPPLSPPSVPKSFSQDNENLHLPAQHTEPSLQWGQSWDRSPPGPTVQERNLQWTLKASSLLQPLPTSMEIRQTWVESLFQDGHSHADCNTVLPR